MECSKELSGHDFTSMIMTEQSILIGTTDGRVHTISLDCQYMDGHDGKKLVDTPLFLFGSHNSVLSVGTGWERTLEHMQCEKVALVSSEKPLFHTIRGSIVAHEFDHERTRQLFATQTQEPAQFQLWMVSLNEAKSHALDMEKYFREQHRDWSIRALSRNGDIAFSNGSAFSVVNPTKPSTFHPETLFLQLTAEKSRGESA
jgi:hypothetical protein